jgi:hypothetical protein
MTRRTRVFASLVALVALAFAQFTVSAHACEMAMKVAAASHGASHPEGCPDSGGDNLCKQHCQYGSAALDAAKPMPPLGDAVGPLLGVVPPPRQAHCRAAPSYAIPPSAGPPPELRFIALRI